VTVSVSDFTGCGRGQNIKMTKSAGSPSAWSARLPILILAGVGFCLASYLTAYQFGAIGRVWEPIFGHGSRTVLHSFVSRLLPVPDAAVGAGVTSPKSLPE
jgi:hypothetical protein